VTEPESERFLSRWVRLKRESTEAPRPDATDGADAPADVRVPQAAPAGDRALSSASVPTPAFDLSTLPSIESITAATDIRPFLAPGVPAELTRAALRRAWIADPAIRDFVGIAENQWDFTDPHAIPGFGPIGPLDDVRRLVAQALGEVGSTASAEPPGSSIAPPEGQSAASVTSGAGLPATNGQLPEIENRQSEPAVRGPVDVQCNEEKDALHKDHQADLPAPAPIRRSHGGALPQ
jgi:Protein of unknown function (DUF3306)